LDLVLVLSLVHYIHGSASALFRESGIVLGARKEERVFLGDESGLMDAHFGSDRLFGGLTLQILKVVLFEEGWVGEGAGGTDALVGELVAHIRRSVTDGLSSGMSCSALT
jgi:hypothetical protein